MNNQQKADYIIAIILVLNYLALMFCIADYLV